MNEYCECDRNFVLSIKEGILSKKMECPKQAQTCNATAKELVQAIQFQKNATKEGLRIRVRRSTPDAQFQKNGNKSPSIYMSILDSYLVKYMLLLHLLLYFL